MDELEAIFTMVEEGKACGADGLDSDALLLYALAFRALALAIARARVRCAKRLRFVPSPSALELGSGSDGATTDEDAADEESRAAPLPSDCSRTRARRVGPPARRPGPSPRTQPPSG